MAKVLAFDLGVTTGYCLIESVNSSEFIVLKHGSFSSVGAVSACVPLIKAWPDLVVLERTASGEWGDKVEEMNQMNRFLHSVFRQIHSIRPVDWKSGPYKRLPTDYYFSDGTKLTQHEKDAFRIAAYSLERILPNVTTP